MQKISIDNQQQPTYQITKPNNQITNKFSVWIVWLKYDTNIYYKKQKWTDVVMEIDHGNENSKCWKRYIYLEEPGQGGQPT
jgi:hypothetical protein